MAVHENLARALGVPITDESLSWFCVHVDAQRVRVTYELSKAEPPAAKLLSVKCTRIADDEADVAAARSPADFQPDGSVL
jgi:hypothetical protein